MRQVKFRGQELYTLKWKYGSYVRLVSEEGELVSHHIVDWKGNWSAVDEKTVGQFTGLISGKRKKPLIPDVYEGDVFRCADEDNGVQYCVVMWIEQRAAFYMVNVAHYGVIRDNNCEIETEFEWLFRDAALYDFSIDCGLTKVGNAHDNPELLK